jgi:uncharacterized protein (TIRG00374 family)
LSDSASDRAAIAPAPDSPGGLRQTLLARTRRSIEASSAIKVSARLLLLVAGLAVIGYLLQRVGPALIWDTFRNLSWRLLIVVVFPACCVLLLDTLAWRFTFKTPPRFGPLFAVRVAGEAVNLGTPTASVGGEPVKAWLLRPAIPLHEGLAAVIADKTTLVASQIVLLAVGLLAGLCLLSLASPLMLIMTGLLLLEIVCVGGFVIVQVGGAVRGGGRLLKRLGVASLAPNGMLEGLDRALRATYVERLPRLLSSVFFHFAASTLETLEIYLVLRFLKIPISLTAVLAIGAFGSAARFFSFMIPASLGALEGANVAIFAAFSVGGVVALTCTLVRRLREIVWIAAGFAMLSFRATSSAQVR